MQQREAKRLYSWTERLKTVPKSCIPHQNTALVNASSSPLQAKVATSMCTMAIQASAMAKRLVVPVGVRVVSRAITALPPSPAARIVRYAPREAGPALLGQERADIVVRLDDVAGNVSVPRHRKRYLFPDGDWDRDPKPGESLWLARAVALLLESGAQYRQHPDYGALRREWTGSTSSQLKRAGNGSDTDDFDRYLDHILTTIASVRQRGVRHGYGTPARFAIGRDGTVLRTGDGRHRFVISTLLGQGEIAGRILWVHRKLLGDATHVARIRDQTLRAALLDKLPASAPG